jgi:trans-2,3-dihydro-3-hydroxyanthranilate isomerase
MSFRYVIADVFTESAFGGNQLAVFPEARGMSDRAMQAIAREFNFAETTFVLPPRDPRHARRVRIFTPRTELPFAGHPTVGTAAVLAVLGLVELKEGAASFVLEEGIGPVAIEVKIDGAAPFVRFTLSNELESPSSCPGRDKAAAVLSLPQNDVRSAWSGSVGVPFYFVHLVSKEVVDRATLDRTAWSENFAHAWAPNLYLFAGDLAPDSRLYARMFAPAYGIEEDAASGSACAALAAHLASQSPQQDGSFTWQIDQGVAMGRASLIEAAAEKRHGRIETLRVGGSTVLVADGTMNVPSGY